MISFYFDGVAPSPSVMVDSQHQKIILQNVPDTRSLERIMRNICVQLGGSAMVADEPLTMQRVRETCIPNTLTLAHRIGKAVLGAQAAGADPIAAVCESAHGRVLFTGKVTDVDRRVERGYNFGRLQLEGTAGDRGRQAVIDLQNEYLICRIDGQPIPGDYPDSPLANWSTGAPGRIVSLGMCDGTVRTLTLRQFY